MERLKELVDRMVAPGPAFACLSASEGHEIRKGCLDLIAQIGTAPEGSHPDEQKPRAETWHQERLNWMAEVARLESAFHEAQRPPEGCILQAVDTGEGWSLEVGYPEGHEKEGEAVALLAWPSSWPEYMKTSKLTEYGFEIC